MKQPTPITTPRDLELWMERHSLDHNTAAEKLGLKRRMLFNYLAGDHPISEPTQRICALIDDLAEINRLFDELANIDGNR